MSLITQYSRISHHTLSISGLTGSTTFSVPSTEDFTDGSWTIYDLALSEIGVDEDRGRAFIRIGSDVKELQLSASGSTPYDFCSTGIQTSAISGCSPINIFANFNMNTGTTFTTSNGGGELSLDYGGYANLLMLSSDSGAFTNGLYMGNDIIEGTDFNYYTGTTILSRKPTNLETAYINVYDGKIDIGVTRNTGGSSQYISGIYIGQNANTNVYSNQLDLGRAGVLINSSNSVVLSGISNTVVIGGTDITATTNNTVYVPDLNIQAGKAIKTSNGGGQIDLDYGGTSNIVAISNDGGILGSAVLKLGGFFGGDVELNSYAGSIYSYSDTGTILEAQNSTISFDNSSILIQRNTYATGNGLHLSEYAGKAAATFYAKDGYLGIGLTTDALSSEITIGDNTSITINSGNSDKRAIIIGSNDSNINSGVTNTVIIGGTGITATASNTTYVGDLVIKKSAVVPTTSASTVGETGSITWDNSYYYVKTATGWGRIALDYAF